MYRPHKNVISNTHMLAAALSFFFSPTALSCLPMRMSYTEKIKELIKITHTLCCTYFYYI